MVLLGPHFAPRRGERSGSHRFGGVNGSLCHVRSVIWAYAQLWCKNGPTVEQIHVQFCSADWGRPGWPGPEPSGLRGQKWGSLARKPGLRPYVFRGQTLFVRIFCEKSSVKICQARPVRPPNPPNGHFTPKNQGYVPGKISTKCATEFWSSGESTVDTS